MRKWLISFCSLFFLYSFVFGQTQYLLAGTYTDNSTSEGIYVFEFDPKTGTLSKHSIAKTGNPSFLAVSNDGKFVYSVNEFDEGAVSAFAFDKKSGTLNFINSQKSNGSSPCYVSLDKTEKWLFCGNYSSGDLGLFPIESNHSIGGLKQFVKHSGSGLVLDRQGSPHVHCTIVSNDNKFLYVPDLGIDKVMIYPFNATTGLLDERKKLFATVDPGGGPRHIIFSKNNKYAYLIEEMSGTVSVFEQKNGRLELVQQLNKLDSKVSNAGGDIHLSPDGRFLYVSQRSNSTIQVFKVNSKSGKIGYIGAQPTLGNFPRNFTIHPSGNFLLVANQLSNDIVIFKINKKTGLLTFTGQKLELGKPVCLKWIL